MFREIVRMGHRTLERVGGEATLRRLAVLAGLAAVAACWFRAISKPEDGDFKLHWLFGKRLLEGTFLYEGGMHVPYPPFWAVAHAPASLLPLPISKAVLFPLGIAATIALFAVLQRLAERAMPGPTKTFWVTALAAILASRYLLRDFAELGVNTLLVLLAWGGILLWSRGRDLLGGISIGFAAALKCTPAIFIAFFAWKRQWKMAGAGAMAWAAFSLAPILWQGPDFFAIHIRAWCTNVLRGADASDPSRGVLGPEPFQNMSLRPSLARFLMRLPDGHPGRADHPLFFDFADLSPRVAGALITAVLASLVLSFLWVSRGKITSRAEPRLLWQLAALSVLMLLLSPITWGQHCAAVLPACFLLAWAAIEKKPAPLSRWMVAATALYGFLSLGLARDIIGRETSYLAESYHAQTIALLCLFSVALGYSAAGDRDGRESRNASR